MVQQILNRYIQEAGVTIYVKAYVILIAQNNSTITFIVLVFIVRIYSYVVKLIMNMKFYNFFSVDKNANLNQQIIHIVCIIHIPSNITFRLIKTLAFKLQENIKDLERELVLHENS